MMAAAIAPYNYCTICIKKTRVASDALLAGSISPIACGVINVNYKCDRYH
jgi:hypothetical protein